MTQQLFTREGSPFEGRAAVNDKGKPGFLIVTRTCHRCGGEGGSEKWRHTGWTCFECDGKGKLPCNKWTPLYSAEQLAKLNATKAKRDAKREAERIAKAEAEERRRDAERAQVIADHADIIARMRGLGDSFLSDLVAQVTVKALPLSQAQIDAAEAKIARLAAEKARLAAAHYIGGVGERREFDLTAVRCVYLGDYGFGETYLTIARTDDGSTVIYKGGWNGLGFPTEYRGEGRDRTKVLVVGSRVRIKATVKAHQQNRKTGEPETVINRPKALEVAA